MCSAGGARGQCVTDSSLSNSLVLDLYCAGSARRQCVTDSSLFEFSFARLVLRRETGRFMCSGDYAVTAE